MSKRNQALTPPGQVELDYNQDMSDNDIDIQEYSDIYKNQVVDVIGRTLSDISVISKKDLPLDDEDLQKIPKIYSKKGRFWIAVKDGQVIGTVAIKDMGDKTAKLKRMFVLVDHHGTGVGQKLLDHAVDFARSQGFKKIILNTHALMNRAHRFYEKNDFVKKEKKGDKFYRYERNL